MKENEIMNNFSTNYEKNTSPFSRPQIIGFMSVDVSRKYQPDLSQLKFLNYIPTGRICLDLNHGITNALKRTTNNNNEKIKLLLKFLLNNIDLVKLNTTEPRLISYRRTLISIMCNAFNNDHVRIMACMFKGSIYLCSLETPHELHNRLSRNRQEDRFCAWGYKFEQYMLADFPDVLPNIEKPVIENEEFFLYYEAHLGSHELMYGAQIDGMLATDGTVLHPPKTSDNLTNLNYLKRNAYIELKTNRLLQNHKQEKNFKRFKLIRCWCQCYLADLKGLLVGYRDDNGIVTKLHYFKTEDIPKYCVNEWQPARSLQNLDNFLSFVKTTFKSNNVNQNEPFSLIFDLYGSQNPITVSQCDGKESILPEWFIEVLKNKH